MAGRLAPRLALLITARFNWRMGILGVGQREIARLWGVTDRTAKREMGAMRELGWIVVRRPAARGRVTEYGIGVAQLREATRPVWAAVGPDFEARMAAGQGTVPATPEVGAKGAVVPFAPIRAATVERVGEGLWAQALALVNERDPALCTAWLSRLRPLDREGGQVTLAAPSAFVADYVHTHHKPQLLAALRALDPDVREVRVTTG